MPEEKTQVTCTRCGLPATEKRPMSQYRATHRGLAECFAATREHASAEASVAAEKNSDDWKAEVAEANQLLRSCYAIADRERENPDTTNWYAIRTRLDLALARQHRLLHPEQYDAATKGVRDA